MASSDAPIELGELSDTLRSKARDSAARVHAVAPTPELSEVLEQLAAAREQGERALVRVGLDLHDGPLQEIAALTTELHLFRDQLVSALGDETPAVRRADALIARVDSIATALRELAGGAFAGTQPISPLSESLSALKDLYANLFAVELSVEPDAAVLDAVPLGEARRTAVVRVVQNALGNAARHSGANLVEVAVRIRVDSIEVDISDNGRGFDVEETLRRAELTGHLGLLGMKRRAQLLAGNLDISSRPGGPTSLRLVLPLRGGRRPGRSSG